MLAAPVMASSPDTWLLAGTCSLTSRRSAILSPGFVVTGWLGIGAPKGTLAEIVQRLNREVNSALELFSASESEMVAARWPILR